MVVSDDVEVRRDIWHLQRRACRSGEKCTHRLIAKVGQVSKLRATLVPGVYDAGDIGEINGVSDATFEADCADCGAIETVHLSERCPVCLSPTRGEFGKRNEEVVYFGPQDFVYNTLWKIFCTACDFRAAGLRWDQ